VRSHIHRTETAMACVIMNHSARLCSRMPTASPAVTPCRPAGWRCRWPARPTRRTSPFGCRRSVQCVRVRGCGASDPARVGTDLPFIVARSLLGRSLLGRSLLGRSLLGRPADGRALARWLHGRLLTVPDLSDLLGHPLAKVLVGDQCGYLVGCELLAISMALSCASLPVLGQRESVRHHLVGREEPTREDIHIASCGPTRFAGASCSMPRHRSEGHERHAHQRILIDHHQIAVQEQRGAEAHRQPVDRAMRAWERGEARIIG